MKQTKKIVKISVIVIIALATLVITSTSVSAAAVSDVDNVVSMQKNTVEDSKVFGLLPQMNDLLNYDLDDPYRLIDDRIVTTSGDTAVVVSRNRMDISCSPLSTLDLGKDTSFDSVTVQKGRTQRDIIYVPEDYLTIQGAIDAATDGDEIIVAPGTYFEAINFLGKAVYLHSSDGPDVTTIDATGLETSVVTCDSSESSDTVLEGFTITGGIGTVVFYPGYFHGGGMYNHNSSPAINNCTFTGNSATYGGGICNHEGGGSTVTNCTFTDNEAGQEGGGIENYYGSMTVTNCTFADNHVYDGGGGGIKNYYGSMTVTNCTFTDNYAYYFGGGIENFEGTSTVKNCMFIGNDTHPSYVSGGGIENTNVNAVIVNCFFFGNTGTAISNFASDPEITNCTFTENNWGIRSEYGSHPYVTNCILWDNLWAEIIDLQDPEEPITHTYVDYSDVQGGYEGTGNINANPLFVDPDNGDYRLLSGSPCIDAGNNNAVPIGITTDLDGNPRFVDDPDTVDTGLGVPPIVDMGAYEYQVQLIGDTNGDGVVDVLDLLEVINHWGDLGGPADVNGDGIVDVLDLLVVINNWS